jgi:hypothetical protein
MDGTASRRASYREVANEICCTVMLGIANE